MTTEGGAFRMASMASEKMVALRRSFASSGLARVNCSVAPDSIACVLSLRGIWRLGKDRAYHGRPNARDGHVFASLALKVHGESLGQHAHADLAHGVGRLAAEEAAVNWRADDDDAATGAHVREDGLDSGVEALWVDALHELEALQGRGWH